MTSPKIIYLAPECTADRDIGGRQWCEDNVWDGDSEVGCDCKKKHKAVKYVRADMQEEG